MLMTHGGYSRDLCVPTAIYGEAFAVDEAVLRVGQKCSSRCDVFGFAEMTNASDFFHNFGVWTIRWVEFGINRPGLNVVHCYASRANFPGKSARESSYGEFRDAVKDDAWKWYSFTKSRANINYPAPPGFHHAL